MRKRELMMMGREQELSTAVELVRAGVSVDVVGGRGSGRSTFLGALRARLVDEEWTAVYVRGVASLRQHPLAALQLAGLGSSPPPPSRGSLFETGEALRTALRQPRSLLVIDDWDDLDESSWGIVETVRRSAGVPVVLSRLQGLRARHTPSGLSASTLEPSYVIDMAPLRFEAMEKILEAYISAPIDAGTTSRIFAKSGGNIGLALSLVDASLREDRMAVHDGENWTATRDLWSPALRAVLEAHLENLPDDALDTLEIIAIVGVADVGTVRKLVDWAALELLEERRMIRFIRSGERHLITVVPPLLVEFFRHEPLTARRIRLTDLITERLGTAPSATAILAEQDPRLPHGGEREAMFARLLQERARARRIVTAAEWEANPSPEAAVRYVRALMHTHTRAAKETISEVLSTTDATRGDPAGRADFWVLRAQWLAYVDGDLEAACAELRREAPSLGVYARVLDAYEVRLHANLATVPTDFGARLEAQEDLPPGVQLALLETQMLVLVILGRFSDARRAFAFIEALDTAQEASIPRALMGLVLLGEGKGEEAVQLLHRGFDEAHGYLDIDAVRAFAAAASLCHLLAGDYAAVDQMLDAVFAAGEPAPFPPGLQQSLLASAAVLAIRRGQVGAGERLALELDAIKTPDGPLPGQSHAWPRVQLLAFDGRTAEAAEMLWSSSESLWARGALFAGATGMLAAVELAPDPDRLAVVQARLAELPDAVTLRAQAGYVSALVALDPEAMMAAVPELRAAGLTGLALSACHLAAGWHGDSESSGGRQRADDLAQEIRDAHPGRVIDTARFRATTVVLTEREKEVGRLASEGLSNREIAVRLVLSVRTVESHMHRVMRKLGIPDRRALRRHHEALA